MKIKQKIKNYILLIGTSIFLLVPAISVSTAGMAIADCSDVQGNINNGVGTAFGTSGDCNTVGNSGSNSLAQLAKTVVNIFSLLVGIVAVIMIIYGGFRYITSGGESGAVGNAKNTIVYAIIGLILVALAQTLVHFVLNAAVNGTVSPTS
jgi:uncharacterized membrane protein